MQCEDNSKLRIPLPEVCQTTDIGCVPIVNGKPDCNPQPDEIPIAFDPSTTTLWLFSCKTREWINFTKFQMCELSALNLDNITNICDILNIGVYFDAGSGCQQGTVTLAELADKILSCLKLETKIITIGQGDGNKIKISIEGLPLDPAYVQGRNIWSEGGSGTEADPLVVATYDPICKWQTKTQEQVDAAGVKHLGACVDGEMSRVPFPPKVCELPSRNQAQVDATNNKELIACLDGEGVKIPYPSSPCSYPQITPEEMMAASDKDFIVCVNGQNSKVPVPYNLYDASPCASPIKTLEETQAMQGSLKILACDGNTTVQIPIQGSGFFSYNTDWKYTCVPQTTGIPTAWPAEGTGPLRMDCDNSLWVWDCEESGWRKTKDGISGVPKFGGVDSVPDICHNLKFKGWYNDSSGTECDNKEVYITAKQLTKIIDECLSEKCNRIYDHDEYRLRPQYGEAHNNNRSFDISKVNLVTLPNWSSQNGDWKIAIWNCASKSFEPGLGSGEFRDGKSTFDDDPGVGQVEIELYADPDKYDCKVFFEIQVETEIVYDVFNEHNYNVAVVAAVDKVPNWTWESEFTGANRGNNFAALPPRFSQVAIGHYPMVNGYWWINDTNNNEDERLIKCSQNSSGGTIHRVSLLPGERETRYLQAFIIFSSRESVINFGSFNFGFVTVANVRAYRGLRL